MKNNNMVFKGITKKTPQVYKSIVNLASGLPSDKICMWLSVPEIWSLLVSGGIVSQIEDSDVHFAMRYYSYGRFESRHFGKKRARYYRHASCAGDPTTPCGQVTVSLELPSNYFQRLSFQNDVESIAAFLRAAQTNDNTPCSKKRPAEDRSLVTPTSHVPCCGWLGRGHQKLIALSLKDFIDRRLESTGTYCGEWRLAYQLLLGSHH
jgi:hypothetical protein